MAGGGSEIQVIDNFIYCAGGGGIEVIGAPVIRGNVIHSTGSAGISINITPGTAHTIVENNTIANNYGYGLHILAHPDTGSAITIRNNIIAYNREGIRLSEFQAPGPGPGNSYTAAYNDVIGNGEGDACDWVNLAPSACPGNISGEPRFVSYKGYDCRLRKESPCIDSGDPATGSGYPGGRTDMGAREFDPGRYLYVSPKDSPLPLGRRVGQSYTTIQAALKDAREQSIVEVAPGRYDGPITIPRGVTVFGSGAGKTCIGIKKCSSFAVEMGDGAALSGFSVTGGGSGAIVLRKARPIDYKGILFPYVSDCGIQSPQGDGIILRGSGGFIASNRIDRCGGCGVRALDSWADIHFNVITDCALDGIRTEGRSPLTTVRNNTIYGNRGAGVYWTAINDTLENPHPSEMKNFSLNIITRNRAGIFFADGRYFADGSYISKERNLVSLNGNSGEDNYVNYSDPRFPDPAYWDLSGEPLFIDEPAYDFRLMPASPCVDWGQPNPPSGPFWGYPGRRIDTGAVQSEGAWAEAITVDEQGNSGGDFRSLREALAAAEEGDTILVMPGTYSEETTGETWPETIPPGVRLFGFGADESIIEGNWDDTLLEASDDVEVGGLTLAFGAPEMHGDGVENVRLLQCLLRNSDQAGIEAVDSQFYVSSCRFYDHNCAAIRCYGWRDGSVIRNSIFWENCDGTIRVQNCSPAIVSNTIAYNDFSCGIIMSHTEGAAPCSPLVANNVIAWNDEGLVAHPYSSAPISPVICNNDVWGNGEDYVDLEPGEGDISADPLLAGPPLDWSLRNGSPCIDAGKSLFGLTDRFFGHGPDIGALEKILFCR
jgi:hypothetical protein